MVGCEMHIIISDTQGPAMEMRSTWQHSGVWWFPWRGSLAPTSSWSLRGSMQLKVTLPLSEGTLSPRNVREMDAWVGLVLFLSLSFLLLLSPSPLSLSFSLSLFPPPPLPPSLPLSLSLSASPSTIPFSSPPPLLHWRLCSHDEDANECW